MLKVCIKCNLEKPLNQFQKRTLSEDGLQTRCRECNSNYNKIWYEKNRENRRLNIKKRRLKVREENNKKIIDFLLKNPCTDCQIEDPLVLEFDHSDPSKKDFNISYLLDGSHNWETIMKEIAKCEVRCANCHIRKTRKQFNHMRWKVLMHEKFK